MTRIAILLVTGLTLITLVSSGCTPNPKLALRSANDPELPSGPPGIRLTVGSSSTETAKDTSPAAKGATSTPSDASSKTSEPSNVLVIHTDAKNIAAVEKALKPTPKFAADLTALKRVLVFTIAKGAYRPADRIVRLRIRLSPENFAFSDYAASASTYSSVTVDKLELTQDNSISGTINPTFATGLTGIGQLTATADRKLDETGEIALHPLDLNVNLDGPDLVIDREAERGQELAGNVLVKITVRPKPRLAGHSDEGQIRYDLVATNMKLLDEKSGLDLAPTKAGISTALLRHVAPRDLTGKLTIEYVKRDVLVGQNTYAEFKQTVSMESSPGPSTCTWSGVTVVSATDLYVPLWGIDAGGTGAVEIQDVSGYRPLAFQDPVDATDLMSWMSRRHALMIGKRHLRFVSHGYPELRLMPLTALESMPRASGGLQCPPDR